VDEIILIRKLPWQEGDPFNGELLEKARTRFSATGLFSTIEVKPDEISSDNGALPILINVKERDYRTIKAGLTFATDEGMGIRASWLHRNFFGRGEHFTLKMSVSEIAYEAEGGLRKPEFLRPDQSLFLSFRMAEDSPDAYTSRNLSASMQIERLLRKDIIISGGSAFKTSDVDQEGDSERFALLSFPLNLTWDTSDDLLDPVEGGRLATEFAPFYDTLRGDMGFARGYASYRRYIPLTKDPFLSLATRVALGTMVGPSRREIPADERFYAGGAGSIRGYEYQTVGPLRNEDPEGGRSLFELSLEFRLKLTKKIGFAAFLDGGSAFTSSVPDFSETLRWGTGGGVRYHTPIGPLRLDIGVPLNRRKDIDDAFQIYVSLGQAF
jgi:translocation and assembly module TamA